MNIVYRLEDVEFEWDSNKAQSNLEKHGITFEEAVEAFFDPFYQVGEANPNTIANIEKREFLLGYSLEQRLLLIIYVERGVRNRIISARPATQNEKKLYEQG
ncbi:BrnT family toxin [Synechocystis sp. PCC 7509]|uniref:BrnT family toxin n=1 Tax=Synechocystis sp. PCC 7509 TaxID=927677 RepID=UPI0002AD083E|nr:BrnT family toxin [Synechocystis sp. PCC 7509]